MFNAKNYLNMVMVINGNHAKAFPKMYQDTTVCMTKNNAKRYMSEVTARGQKLGINISWEVIEH